MENPEIPGRIQMAPFIPVEIFRQKSNTFRGIIFFPFLPKRPKFSILFVWITSARLHAERKRNIYRYFVNGTTQSRSCFRCQKKIHYHLTDVFHRNFRTNGKRSAPALFQFTSILLHHFAAGACCKTTFPHTVFPVHILLQDSSCIWSV